MITLIKLWLKATEPLEGYLHRRKPSALLERVFGENPYYTIHDFNNRLYRYLDGAQ